MHVALDPAQLATATGRSLARMRPADCLLLHSAASDRSHYLQRPDLGRRLDAASVDVLDALVRPDVPAAGQGVENRAL